MFLHAKGREDRVDIRQHTKDVLDSFQAIFGKTKDSPTEFGKKFQQHIGFDNWDEFYINATYAIILHDIGKANTGFQNMILHKDNTRQLIRHEYISGVIALQIADELSLKMRERRDGFTLNKKVLVAAIRGHHLQAYPPGSDKKIGFIYDTTTPCVEFLFEGLKGYFDDYGKYGITRGLIITPTFWHKEGYALNGKKANDCLCINDWFDIRRKGSFSHVYHRANYFFNKNEDQSKLLTGVRSALIFSDAVGSSVLRLGCSIEEFVNKNLHDVPKIDHVSGSFDKMLQSKGLMKKDLRRFQRRSLKDMRRLCLVHSCGGGKTIAAFNWAFYQNVQRVIYLTPTRGISTEQFYGYTSFIKEGSTLLHSSSKYAMESMFDAKDDRSLIDYGTEDHLYALGCWKKNNFMATFDQFFGFAESNYFSYIQIPLLMQSAIIIDEFHSYDKKMISVLKKFLKRFPDIPVLLMSATASPGVKKDMAECGIPIFVPNDVETKKSNTVKRYKITHIGAKTKDEIFKYFIPRIKKAIKKGEKILWVCNTVRKCQMFSEMVSKHFDIKMHKDQFCYHSRFTVSDREVIHRSCIDKMKEEEGFCILISTQVAEMALDISSFVLMTEESPITSFIQRVGRCNRKLDPKGVIGKVYIYRTLLDNGGVCISPYSKDSLVGVDAFFKDIGNKKVSQLDLCKMLEKHGSKQKCNEEDSYCTFFDGGVYSYNRTYKLTEGDGIKMSRRGVRQQNSHFITAIFEKDVPEILRLIKGKKCFDGFTISVPISKERIQYDIDYNKKIGLPHYLNVLAEKNTFVYDEFLGYAEL